MKILISTALIPCAALAFTSTPFSVGRQQKPDISKRSMVNSDLDFWRNTGFSMSQDDFMKKDTVLVVNGDDEVIGSESKRTSHEFNPKQPTGILHRAFSVFIFDESTNELLLQQRATDKITFKSVWTNTCCSHPLYEMTPNEVDCPQDVATGAVPGAKNAAIRKLEHELGIPPSQLPIEKFKFLTRLQYWAADTVTHGRNSPWGEHEIDYVLFFVVKTKNDITLKPNKEEVNDVRWVSQSKLIEMMDDSTLLFSPWFRIIAQRWVLGETGWWNDLKDTMETDIHCDYASIARFDPPPEHMGGLGNASAIFQGLLSSSKEEAASFSVPSF